MRRILVTGAAGFVGGHVLPLLAEAGDRVAGIGRGEPPALPAGVTYEAIDLLDETALAAFVGRFRPTEILHLAGLASVADSTSGPGQTWRVNVNGLMNLVAAVEAVAVLLAADVVVPVAVPVVERKSNPKCSATIPTNMTQ